MPTLRALLEVLGPALRPLTGETGLDAEVSEVVLVGPGDALPDNPDALLVCVQHDGLQDTAVKAAGLVVKLHGADEAPWSRAPLAVLAADDTLPWNHLLQLLSTAASASGSSGAMGDLFALANSIAAMVGGAVASEDPHRRVLA